MDKTNAAEKIEKPCRAYDKGRPCKSGLDHCFNCGRHVDADGNCPKGCGADEAINDAALDEEA